MIEKKKRMKSYLEKSERESKPLFVIIRRERIHIALAIPWRGIHVFAIFNISLTMGFKVQRLAF